MERKTNWLNPRTWPHPELGNYCGYYRRWDTKSEAHDNDELPPMPENEVDGVCLLHDNDDSVLGDLKFAGRMFKINPFNNKNYDNQVYDRAYQYGSAIVMFGIGCFTVPFRGAKKLFKKK